MAIIAQFWNSLLPYSSTAHLYDESISLHRLLYKVKAVGLRWYTNIRPKVFTVVEKILYVTDFVGDFLQTKLLNERFELPAPPIIAWRIDIVWIKQVKGILQLLMHHVRPACFHEMFIPGKKSLITFIEARVEVQ